MSAVDCDFFSDSYSCVFRQCNGFQSPYPFVRLGNTTGNDSDLQMKGIALVHGNQRVHAATHSLLLSLKVDVCQPCASFLEIVTTAASPIRLHSNSAFRFFAKLEEEKNVCAVIDHYTPRNAWSASFFTTSSEGRSIFSVFRSVSSSSLTDNCVWCLSLDGVQCFDHNALFNECNPFYTLRSVYKFPFNITALCHHTAALFHSDGVARIDSRVKLPTETLIHTNEVVKPLWNGEVGSTYNLLCYSTDKKLLVFDCRKPNTVLYARESPSFLKIKSRKGQDAALLICGDQVALLDLPSLSIQCAAQTPDGDSVLDANLISCTSRTKKFRVSSVAGMIYDWKISE